MSRHHRHHRHPRHLGHPGLGRRSTTRVERTVRLVAGLAAVAACLGVAGSPASSAPAERGVVWNVAWKAPVTTAGPNRFDQPAVLAGTASYALGPISRVDYTVAAPSGFPESCGTFPRTGSASLHDGSFTVKPALACNGTYAISVVAQSGSGLLAAKSSALKAPATLADPGPAPSGFGGVAQGSMRSVTLSWSTDPDPDVVGYRLRRDGIAVADMPANVRIHTDLVPSSGSYTYDLQTLRWGGDGPGSAAIASAPTEPLVAQVVPDAPATPIAPTGGGPGSTGATGGAAGGSSHAGTGAGSAEPPSAGKATASLPAAGTASAKVGDRSRYRSGGSISPSAPDATADSGFLDRLPYAPGTSRQKVELSSPARTQTVSRSVSVPGHRGPGLLVPIAVVLVLVASSLQVRSLLGRAGALRAAGHDRFAS